MGRFAAAIACILAAACGGPAAAEGTLRILSYNIHHGRGTDGVVDLERIATVIRGCDADVALLQEVDDQTVRTGHVDQPAELAHIGGFGRVRKRPGEPSIGDAPGGFNLRDDPTVLFVLRQ